MDRALTNDAVTRPLKLATYERVTRWQIVSFRAVVLDYQDATQCC